MKIVILHYQPLEIYPPTINMLQFFSERGGSLEIDVYTTSIALDIPEVNYPNISVRRLFRFGKSDSRIGRLLKTVYYNIQATAKLFRKKPDHVIYFETMSAFPAYLYFLFYSSKTKLFIHYHEYTSTAQYRKGMVINRMLHQFEIKSLYRKAAWISQTNSYRSQLFRKDHPDVPGHLVKDLPNFPPSSWVRKTVVPDSGIQAPLRVVQLGAFSMKNMYTSEFLTYVENQKGDMTLDIYSLNIQQDVLEWLKENNCRYVNYKGPLAYEEIPSVISNYDVGVILYKAYSDNVVYCASNKLFEYLALNLDVWVSKVMKGSVPYLRDKVYPKVLMVDFERLADFDWRKARSRKGLGYQPSPYVMEDVYAEFLKGLIN